MIIIIMATELAKRKYWLCASTTAKPKIAAAEFWTSVSLSGPGSCLVAQSCSPAVSVFLDFLWFLDESQELLLDVLLDMMDSFLLTPA